jgi:hypothetical protein
MNAATLLSSLALGVALFVTPATAQTPPTSQPVAVDVLKPVAFLVGGDWRLDAKWANGSPARARASFVAENNGTAISGRTFELDAAGAETQRDLTVFAVADGQLTAFVFHKDGTSRATPATIGAERTISFAWTKPGKPGQPGTPLRQVITPVDADHYRWQSFMQIKGEWHTTIDGVWTRAK